MLEACHDQSIEYNRVLSLIPHLKLGDLRKQKILPKKALFTKVPKGGSFPAWAEKFGYSNYGCWMENIVQNVLLYREKKVEDCIQQCKSALPLKFQKSFKGKDYLLFAKTLRKHFTEVDVPQTSSKRSENTLDDISDETILFEPNIQAPEGIPIVGHPDVVSGHCVYDIKTTGRFNAMRSKTILQILSYYCLSQVSDVGGSPRRITHVGLILPAQNKIFYVDLKDWDWWGFWESLCACVSLKKQRLDKYKCTFLERTIYDISFSQVGGGVSKKDFAKIGSIRVPVQFYLGGCSSTRVTKLPKKVSKMIRNFRHPNLFIHAPHVLNLCKPFGKNRESDKDLSLPWTCEMIYRILESAKEMNVNGVVVHCGRHTSLEEEAGRYLMWESLCVTVEKMIEVFERQALDFNDVTANIPKFILENPAGQGKELYRDPEEFSKFYLSLPDHVQKHTSVCVDTCHAFAAGYNPMEFIRIVESHHIPIDLIHYTDTLVPFGGCVDRHERIGKGNIGMRTLLDVLLWANQKGVPCVLE